MYTGYCNWTLTGVRWELLHRLAKEKKEKIPRNITFEKKKKMPPRDKQLGILKVLEQKVLVDHDLLQVLKYCYCCLLKYFFEYLLTVSSEALSSAFLVTNKELGM